MSEATKNFFEHCSNSARNFIRTVLIADNQPFVVAMSEAPRVATRKSSPFPGFKSLQESGDNANMPGAEELKIASSEYGNHDIDLRKIVNSFSQLGLVCGSYLPDSTTGRQEIVETTFLAAKFADISIIDWQLEVDNSEAAISVIKRLLEHDLEIGGRLRLILVYTGEPDLDSAAAVLESGLDGLATISDENKRLLISESSRIRFINKPTRKDYVDNPDVVSWADLPGRAIEEFTILSQGLLKAFALDSIAAIRNDTHRLLAQFSPSMDGVFAGQRSTSSDPDDAGRLLTDVILSEFSITVNKAKIAERVVGKSGALLWLKAQANLQETDVNITFKTPGKDILKLNSAAKVQLLEGGFSGVKKVGSQGGLKVCNSFFASDVISDDAHKDFSVLSTLARHSGVGCARVVDAPPVLTLGLVLQSVEPIPGSDVFEYILCLQPKCDAVRLDALPAPRGFSFVEMAECSVGYEIVLPIDSTYKTFNLPYKDLIIRTIRFAASTGRSVVAAEKINEQWHFTDCNGKKWKWIAELREQNSLSLVNKIMSALTRVGLNQPEWLRLQSSK
ncbi:response regulator receiver domain [Pseudomonas jessenii]|uniref:response regulator receiver domain n=1 Tax=Pseudomonas jessenii TaxID=77298 RepID=UPI00389132A0